MYVEGNSHRAVARILKVNPQRVVNWVKRCTAKLPNAPVPKRPKVAELDELFTYVGQKKKRNLRLDGGRSGNGRQYFSDAFPAYNTLYYGAPYEMRTDKLETYSVEAVNADLRHYLKRLARKSRSFLAANEFSGWSFETLCVLL